MRELFVCPKINALDPAAAGFDGGGHRVSSAPGSCHEARAADDRIGCTEPLEAASVAWLAFYGIEPEPEPDTNTEETPA